MQNDHNVIIISLLSNCFNAQAAKWRQGQRADQVKKRRLIVWEVDETEPWEEEEEEPKGIAGLLRRGGKQPKRQVNLSKKIRYQMEFR